MRFEHALGCESGRGDPVVSHPVALTTLELPHGDSRTDVSGESEVDHVTDLVLVLLVWVCDHTTYMGVFDLNCWYQAHMPGYVRSEEGPGLCSYFSVCEVDCGNGSGVLDLAVDSTSVAKFAMSGCLVEQYFFPSSLKFDLMVLTQEGWLDGTHLGLQRKVLAELSRLSPVVQPSELYQFCLLAGLSSGLAMEHSLLAQRCSLLTVALVHSMVGVMVAAARDWVDGKFSKAGCTLRFLLDWAWARVASIKDQVDGQTVSLFDHSLSEIDTSARGLLVSLSGQLAQLVTVLSAVASFTLTTEGLEELECRLSVPEGPGNPFPVSALSVSGATVSSDTHRSTGGGMEW